MSDLSLKMPEVPFGKYSISRLIAGGNPIDGGSHQTHLMDMQMSEYFTPSQTLEFVKRCRKQGINTWQSHYSQKIADTIRQYRESGDNIQWICLCSPDEVANKDKFSLVLELNPIGVVFHGETTDVLWREKKADTIPDTLKKIRDSGVMVGLSTHNPEVINYAESEGWDLDFYMACVYRKSRNHAELMEIMKEIPIGEIYLPQDPSRMCETIRKATKPCLAFKILTAGRTCDSSEQVRKVFEFIFSHIKSTDAAIVGMYPRYTDQIKENADFTRMYG